MLEKDFPEEVKKALEVLEEISKDPKMQEAALRLEIDISDYMTRIGEAEDRGIEKGLEISREEGRKKGEHNKAIEISKALKLEGEDNNFIAKITGLTTEEIDALK